jgi:hypothetical protein
VIWTDDQSVFLAGQRVPPGCYVRTDPPDGRTVTLERTDVLPASLDGHVAVYMRIEQRTPSEGASPGGRPVVKHQVPID